MRTKHPFPNSPCIFAAEVISVALLLAVNAGCGSTKVTTQTNTSVGQQLLDLQKAHDQGLINDKDYEKLRTNIVKENK